MSGICGMLAFDGTAPSLGPILDKLERRGPDATRAWNDGPVALGHTLLATTPEALVEVLPLTDEASGCTITTDARLDNREELIAALGLEGETRTIGDGELILRAYLEWGEDCPKHLLGDFAFAIWDPRHQRLLCARDHMGMRQLLHHHAPGRLFAFATEAEALIAHPDVPNRINEGRIADYLDDLEGIDFTSTFFEEIFRLPPAHALTVNASGLAIRRYWVLPVEPELKLDSDLAYADAFLTVFTRAVRSRLRSAGPVGSMLSGGMDSGSVAAVAARLLGEDGSPVLRTFSAIGPNSGTCPESKAIHAILSLPRISPTTVDHSALGPLSQQLWQLGEDVGEPFDDHMTLIRSIYLSAQQGRVKVMLDGVAGDVVLTSGNRVAHHLRGRRFQLAWREACGEEAFWQSPHYRFRSFLSGSWVAFMPAPIRRAKRRLGWRLHDAIVGFGGRIDRQFARRVGLNARRKEFHRHIAMNDLTDTENRIQAILHPHLVVARERYDRTAAALGIEPRDPFMDVRLVQFCLSLPAEQLQRAGWPKYVLRVATKGLLPDEIRWRRGKEHLGWTFTQQLFSEFPEWRDKLNEARTALSYYVAGDRRARLVSNSRLERDYGLFYLARWLARNKAPIDNVDSLK